MTSPPPLACETCYHIFDRGNNRENIFLQERNYQHFLRLYTRYIDPVAETFAFCLLKNHFHLLVWIKTAEEITRVITTLKVFFGTFKVWGRTSAGPSFLRRPDAAQPLSPG